MNESGSLSEFLTRLQITAVNTNMETCPLAMTILLKCTECLPEKSEQEDKTIALRGTKERTNYLEPRCCPTSNRSFCL